jgi:RNA polymerase sigma factor (sigma-70 family)
VTTFRAEAPAVLQETRDTAWRDVVALERRSGQRLLGYALRLGIDRGRAADLVQEALLRLWRELDRGTPIASTEAWTYRALSRLAMDEHRLHRRVLGLVTRLGERDAVRAVEVDATDRVAVWVQVDRLPARQRQAIYLRYQADLDFEEVARVMGITAGTARSLVSQAMATLRMNLVNEAGET